MAYLRYINGRTDRQGAYYAARAPQNWPFFTGTVKWFNQEKGYGFIAPNDGSPDVFVHVKAVQKAGLHRLEQGQVVEFELTTRPDGRTVAEKLRAVRPADEVGAF